MSEHVFAAPTFEEVVARAKQEALEMARVEERCPLCEQAPCVVAWVPRPTPNRSLWLSCKCACGVEWWARARWTKEGA